MTPRVSVHIIAKETTPLGELFFRCCLQALLDSHWPDELIIVDDGCTREVRDMAQGMLTKFAQKRVSGKFIDAPAGPKTYSDLRNMALAATDPSMNIFHWVDTDEVYMAERLTALRHALYDVLSFRQAWTHFYHFIFDPYTYQFRARKDNIFAFHQGLHWTKGVHEHVDGMLPGKVLSLEDVEYLHLGYLRPQWQTCLKWLHYDYIEMGNLDRYKNERLEDEHKNVYTKPWFRDWRTPNTVLDDRRAECEKQGKFPDIKVPMAADPIYQQAGRWPEFLMEIEDQTFWNTWQQLAKATGGWAETLDAVLRAMVACDWSYNGKKIPTAATTSGTDY